MATVRRFEDLVVWQRARELVRDVYRITSTGKFAADYGLKDQIRRAAVSVMSNLAEGFERGTRIELVNYFFIAKGSAGEVRAQFYVARDLGYITEQDFRSLKIKVENISRLIYSFVTSAKTSARSGTQYKPATNWDREWKRQEQALERLMADRQPKPATRV